VWLGWEKERQQPKLTARNVKEGGELCLA
jgi:hypothetical protein